MTQSPTQDTPVLIIGSLLPSLQEKVEAQFAATRYWQLDDAQAWVAAHGAEVKAVVTTGAYGLSADLLGQLPNLEAIFSFGVGYDSIAVEAAKARGIVVTNTPGVLDDCVADLALALMLDVSRRISEADRFVRAGKWLQGKFPLAVKLGGKKLGVVGLGNIGQAIAKRAEAFGMQILYHNRSQKAGVSYEYFAELDAMIEACDVLVLAVPGGKATDGLIGAGQLAKLGKKGYLINIARGTVVDQPALIAALQQGVIAGAGLDVFEKEPQVPEALLGMDNVVLLPHVGSGTHETRQAMGDLVWANIESYYQNGKKLITAV